MDSTFATTLAQKQVMDSNGRVIGEFDDISLNSQTGDLQELLVKKTGDTNQELAHTYETDSRGRYVIPTQTIESVDDCIIVSAS